MTENKRFIGEHVHLYDVAEKVFSSDDQVDLFTRIENSENRDTILSSISTLMHTAPEARGGITRYLYENTGLREILKGLSFDEDERRELLNGLAGVEVVHKKRN